MGDIAVPDAPVTSSQRLRWGRHTFYLSNQMAAAAHRLSEAEEDRTGRRVGAGQIIDRALRRYVAEILTPDELARLLSDRIESTSSGQQK